MRSWVPVAVGALLYAAAVTWMAGQVPAEGVPVHFGGLGVADRFGTRGEAVGGYVVIGVIMLGVAAGLQLLVRRSPVHVMNIPHRDYWTVPDRIPQVRTMLAHDAAVIMGATLAFLALPPIGTVIALHRDPPSLPIAAIYIPLLLFVGALVVWVVTVVRHRYRPEE